MEYLYLYSLNHYEYKIGCIYDDSDLYINHLWTYKILKTYNDIKNCIQIKPLQLLPDLTGYSCDLCRIEVGWNEFMFHCNCDKHDFCISCIYSLIFQQTEMKQLLYGLLKEFINDDCIYQIVTFCVGRVIKLEKQMNNEDWIGMIDQEKSVGSKRKMNVNSALPNKRQKLK